MIALPMVVGLIGPNEMVVLQNTQLAFLIWISAYPLQLVGINLNTVRITDLTPLDHNGEKLTSDAWQLGKIGRERGKVLAGICDGLLFPTSIVEKAVVLHQV